MTEISHDSDQVCLIATVVDSMMIMMCVLFISIAINVTGLQRRLPHVILSKDSMRGLDDSMIHRSPTARFCAGGNSEQLTSFDKSDIDIVMKQVEDILLPKLFGHPQFRPGQREVISKVLAGNYHIKTIDSLTELHIVRM